MTKKAGFYNRPTDWVTGKAFERETARLERLYQYQKERIRVLEEDVAFLKQFLADGPHGAVFAAFKAARSEKKS